MNQPPFYAILPALAWKLPEQRILDYRLYHYHHLAVLALLCLLYGNSIAKQNRWECLPTANGESWQCGEAGSPQQKPIMPPQKTTPAPKTTPAAAPFPQEPEEQSGQMQDSTEEPAVAPPTRKSVGQPAPVPKAIDSAPTRQQPEENTPAPAIPRPYTSLLDQGMEWDQCHTLPAAPPEKPADNRIVIEADAATALPEEDNASFRGNVIIRQPNQTLYADDLFYDHQRQLIKVDEQLLIRLRDLRLLGSQAWFDLNKHQGEMAQVSYRIPSRKARGTASKMVLLNENHSRYENISYTTCPPGNKGFVLSANSMEIDQKRQIGTFRAAKLHFLGVPIFYAPKLTVPLDGARKSGLLAPSLGYSSRNGADVTIPYYFNLAPNYDATLMPRLLGRRGLLVGGEFRFLTPAHQGELRAEILPDDRLYDNQSSRGALRARSRSNLAFITPGLTADLDLNWVSDRDYLDDLGQSLTVTSTRHLRSRAALSWRNRDWDALAELRHYKTLDRNILPQDRPYSLLPRVAFDWRKHQGPAGLDYGFNAELSNFYREDSVTGQRIDLNPRVSLPMHRDWGFVEPALSGRYTSYSLDDQLPGKDPSPARSTYSISLDSGLFFDRETSWFGQAITHTLEPRAYYLYTPYENQSDIPLFDTSYLDFNFGNLFHDNRFNGPDRVGDANQLTLALTSRIIAGDDGRELLRTSIGQIYYFEDRQVTLDESDLPDASSSSVIAELSTGIFDHWLLRAAVQVDPHADTALQQGLVQASYRGSNGKRIHASWRLREGILEQTDLAAYWPVSEKISLIGRWYYSMEESHSLETVAGLEYSDCCWRIRAVWRRYLDSNGTEYNNTALLQLELNGLGKLGNNIDNFLDRTIYGY